MSQGMFGFWKQQCHDHVDSSPFPKKIRWLFPLQYFYTPPHNAILSLQITPVNLKHLHFSLLYLFQSYSSDHSKRDFEDRNQNGVIDYKKVSSRVEIDWSILLLLTISFQLWEESQISNSCLREDLAKVRDELTATRKKLESSMQVSCQLPAFTKVRIIQ